MRRVGVSDPRAPPLARGRRIHLKVLVGVPRTREGMLSTRRSRHVGRRMSAAKVSSECRNRLRAPLPGAPIVDAVSNEQMGARKATLREFGRGGEVDQQPCDDDVRTRWFTQAAERLLQSNGELRTQYDCFKKNPNVSGWLEDAALFAAIDKSIDAFSWYEWPEPLKNRHLGALEDIYQKQKDFIEIFMAQQFLFQRQWQRIRTYAKKLGISIMGDMPIYVGYHSADVWANRKSFLLDKNGFPTFVSGVPPDAFSETGQLWNSPLYDWKAMEADGFTWWVKRIKRALDLYDEFRIDHFRGLAGFWAVPSDSKVALVGSWRAGPRNAFFDALFKAVGRINIIAEDLGVITEDVVELRKSIGAPGMAVLQFAFGGGPDNPHLLHNHELEQVVYTGTHDNDTVLGWWQNLPEDEKQIVFNYLPVAKETDIWWALIIAALSSAARTSMLTMQDILGLDSSARMNTPATQKGNWKWRMPSSVGFDSLSSEAAKLKELLALYNRL